MKKNSTLSPEERADILLRENLLPRQYETYQKFGWILVRGGTSGRIHLIVGTTQSYTIYDIHNMDSVSNPYFVPFGAGFYLHIGTVPVGDHIVAKKILIENDEGRLAAYKIPARHKNDFTIFHSDIVLDFIVKELQIFKEDAKEGVAA